MVGADAHRRKRVLNMWQAKRKKLLDSSAQFIIFASRVPAQDLAGSVYGNPHTEAGGGGDGTSAAAIEDARAATLAMCRASPADYECVFTSGATGGDAAVAAQARTFFC